jgi:hypothetical protein
MICWLDTFTQDMESCMKCYFIPLYSLLNTHSYTCVSTCSGWPLPMTLFKYIYICIFIYIYTFIYYIFIYIYIYKYIYKYIYINIYIDNTIALEQNSNAFLGSFNFK